ncbi:MAG: undecaprenyldiphospho-muramoylpentapeptide beta-N-acetylglucosaminyltransferase [Oscillospiraceae bacterium]|nr:undecaprenyldiphospho-muramoylpentapeptide beta-N-acetylglucosaminyltransferase [Oscillospiraceae bacterium]
MRILLSGGGTAGHINPALAIAKTAIDRGGAEVLFVGTPGGMEQRLVPREGYELRSIVVMGLRRRLTLENVKVAVNYFTSIRDAGRIIDEFKPDVVVGTGGYVCAPVVKAAFKRKIPTLIHEQNVFPGLAIKMLAKKADVTAVSFDETKDMIQAKNMVLTGNPLRPNLFEPVNTMEVRAGLGFDDRPVVLIFGGSLGAEHINDALLEMLGTGDLDFNLIAATGEKHYDGFIKAAGAAAKKKGVKILPYIHNMHEIFALADLVVCRAGAITVSELGALGKASVLIPSPYVAHNHQEYNARYLEKNGAARVLLEKDLSGSSLRTAIDSAVLDSAALAAMCDASKRLGISDACDTIWSQLCKISSK